MRVLMIRIFIFYIRDNVGEGICWFGDKPTSQPSGAIRQLGEWR